MDEYISIVELLPVFLESLPFTALYSSGKVSMVVLFLYVGLEPNREDCKNCIMRSSYASPNIIRVINSGIRWAGDVACMRDKKCKRPRNRWEDNIRMCLREIEWDSVDWIHMAQNRDQWWGLANTIINLQVP
jgi:hypothetical protein